MRRIVDGGGNEDKKAFGEMCTTVLKSPVGLHLELAGTNVGTHVYVRSHSCSCANTALPRLVRHERTPHPCLTIIVEGRESKY